MPSTKLIRPQVLFFKSSVHDPVSVISNGELRERINIKLVINLEFVGVCKTILATIHMGIGKSFYKQNFETNCWPKESNAKAKL